MAPTLREIAFFTALIGTALALGAALAHAYALPNKIGLGRDAYYVTQAVYRGWDNVAWLLAVELAGIVGVILTHLNDRAVLWPALLALGAFLASQAVFWGWTMPANIATAQWTEQVEHWQALRAAWEYSHLGGAVLQLIAMCALSIAVLARPVPDPLEAI